MSIVTNVPALVERIEAAQMICEGGVAVEGTEAAIFKDTAGYFGVVETRSDELGSVFETADLNAKDAIGIEFMARDSVGAVKTHFLAKMIIPDYQF